MSKASRFSIVFSMPLCTGNPADSRMFLRIPEMNVTSNRITFNYQSVGTALADMLISPQNVLIRVNN
jgi:hypothetical protein